MMKSGRSEASGSRESARSDGLGVSSHSMSSECSDERRMDETESSLEGSAKESQETRGSAGDQVRLGKLLEASEPVRRIGRKE
mmetsp:Transcript_32896/g.104029  ORF Transcript_32896/g.104029 Transcript_32896/m.104029 type:complete len:83 (+) Transcript_32896:1481-1729(+)